MNQKILLGLIGLGMVMTSLGQKAKGGKVKLPEPKYSSKISVEEALKSRRSVRSYKNEPLTIEEVSQLLWAAQGKTAEWGGRTAPSAGATYPLDTYLVCGRVNGLAAGVYKYDPQEHSIEMIKEKDVRTDLAGAAWGQSFIAKAPITIVLTAIYRRTTARYGERGIRYVHMEVGHVGQNIHLQCETMGLGTVMVGAFSDERVKEILGVKAEPLYIIPVGRK
uniref:SagB/ThcOx family dehydrogenase n=1 Tax=candidate division WOR-3 bacterium TaxID=2052148 RepID=A0A7C6A9Z0_UNCW3